MTSRKTLARASFLLTLLVLGFPLQASLAEKPPVAKQYIVRLTLKSGSPLGSIKAGTQSIEAQPTLVVTQNREANFQIGGEVKVGGKPVFYGTSVDLVLDPADEGQVLLTGRIEVSSVNHLGVGLAEKETREIHLAQTVRLNEKETFVIHTDPEWQRWLEVLVEPVKAPSAKN